MQDSREIGPLFIEELVEDNQITNREFSFVMYPHYETDSHVDFGPVKEEHMRGNTSLGIFYLQVEDDYFWSTFT